jgi:hypothetical protein
MVWLKGQSVTGQRGDCLVRAVIAGHRDISSAIADRDTRDNGNGSNDEQGEVDIQYDPGSRVEVSEEQRQQ